MSDKHELWKAKLTKGWQGVVGLDDELPSLINWLKKHSKTCTKPRVTIAQSGGSGIGINTIVRCDACGTGADLSDYHNW